MKARKPRRTTPWQWLDRGTLGILHLHTLRACSGMLEGSTPFGITDSYTRLDRLQDGRLELVLNAFRHH